MSTSIMKITRLGWVGVLGLVYGCASHPPAALEQAQTGLRQAETDPQIARFAPVEIHEAEQLMNQAEQVWSQNKDATEAAHLAYLTQRKVEQAKLKAERELAEQEIVELTEQRKALLLETRTREAMQAKTEAEQARQKALEEARRAQEEAMKAKEALEKAKQLETQLAELQAKQTERGVEITLGDILFEFGKAQLKPGAMQRLYRLVTVLKENPTRKLVIEGHTDSVGSEQYNRQLSERRAQAVAEFLTQNGISSERITTIGYGESYPVAPNDNAEGRQRNRRVEVVILNEGQSAEDIRRQ